MSTQLKVIKEVHSFFTKENIPYVFIGGFALQHWGQPRFTRDVDVTILVHLGNEEAIVKKILSAFSPRIADAFEFALKNRVCLVENKDGYEIDVSLGIPGYEQRVIKRAVDLKIFEKLTVKICSAEDLIIHKSVAARPIDLSDIESIIIRQGKKLDAKYIRKWLKEFSEVLEKGEILLGFEDEWRRLLEKS